MHTSNVLYDSYNRYTITGDFYLDIQQALKKLAQDVLQQVAKEAEKELLLIIRKLKHTIQNRPLNIVIPGQCVLLLLCAGRTF